MNKKNRGKIIIVGVIILIGIVGLYHTKHTTITAPMSFLTGNNPSQNVNINQSIHCNESCYHYDSCQKNQYTNPSSTTNKKGIGRLISDVELTEEDIQLAEKYQVSETKILFVKKALSQNPDLKIEDLIYMPAREIANYITE